MLIICAFAGALAEGWSAASDRAAGGASRLPESRPPASAAPSSAVADLPPQCQLRAWNSIVLHHSATGAGDVASIDAVHRQQKDQDGRPWLGIGYHFVVGNGRPMGDGEVQPTFRWEQQLPGAHSGKRDYNERGIGICLVGNFEDTAPTAKQLAALGELLKTLSERHAIPRERIVRHADVQATACPGRLFPWERIVSIVPARAP